MSRKYHMNSGLPSRIGKWGTITRVGWDGKDISCHVKILEKLGSKYRVQYTNNEIRYVPIYTVQNIRDNL